MIVRIQAKECDRIGWIMFSEEELSRVVGQCDALLWYFEVNFSWCWQWTTLEETLDRFSHRLRSRQRFCIAAEQVKNIAGSALLHELPLFERLEAILGDVMIGKNQPSWQCQWCDWMLVDQGRQWAEDGLVGAALQSDSSVEQNGVRFFFWSSKTYECSPNGRLNKKMTNELIGASFRARWRMSHSYNQTKSVWKWLIDT